MKYRQDLDGLRAIAVFSVILYHAEVQVFKGGFVGVDVFFVISGFLISRLIFEEIEAGTFNLIEFYKRRARRILPLLFFVLVISQIVFFIVLTPYELKSFYQSTFWALLISSNFYFWRTADYFETSSSLLPLLHTWTIGVEEQFYLLYPIFLLTVFRLNKKLSSYSLLILFISSFALCTVLGNLAPKANYYLLPTRAWEFVLGCLGAKISLEKNLNTWPKQIREALSMIGLLLIVVSVLLMNKSYIFPGFYTLLPTIGTVLIILFATKATFVSWLLSNKYLAGFGTISYSLYLWHQPIFAFFRNLNNEIELELMFFILVLIYIFSKLSYRYIEYPFRFSARFSSTKIVIAILVFGFLIAFFSAYASRIDLKYEDKLASKLTGNVAVYSSNINERRFIKAYVSKTHIIPDYLIIGSSRSMQIGRNSGLSETMNLSVSGASIEDVVAIWNLASDKFKSAQIVIGVEPWMFNGKYGQEQWMDLGLEFNKEALLLGFQGKNYAKFSPKANILDEMYRDFYDDINQSRIESSDNSPELRDKILSDGSRVINIESSNKNIGLIEKNALEVFDYGMKNFEYSSLNYEYLKNLLREISSEYQVLIFLPPYQHKTYQLIENRLSIVIDLENKIKDLADSLGITVLGSYNPRSVNCEKNEFFDGLHPKESCVSKILLNN